MPGGAFGKRKLAAGTGPGSADAACCSLSTKGHVFAMECAMDPVVHADLNLKPNQRLRDDPCIRLELTEQFALQLFDTAARFYRSPAVELPGYLNLCIGIIDAVPGTPYL